MRELVQPPAPSNPGRLSLHITIRNEGHPEAATGKDDFEFQDVILRVEAVQGLLGGPQPKSSFSLAGRGLARQLGLHLPDDRSVRGVQ
jgi:hypothetical protein